MNSEHVSAAWQKREYSPVFSLSELNHLLHLHNLDMIQVLRPTTDHSPKWINLTLLYHPALWSLDDAVWEPLWKNASFKNESSRQ